MTTVIFDTPAFPYPLLLPLGTARTLLKRMRAEGGWNREAADLEQAIARAEE